MTELHVIQENIISEINEAKQSIKTDGYPMSIGELINLYRDGDIILDPAFQRLFRWEDEQKTKLIESILIGIPIPEIFVAQKADGTWHVVDGVQRLSTILQTAGVLDGYEPLTFETCKYIPSLEGQTWKTMPSDVQRLLKRSKLKLSIILTQDSDEAQYELFQRLNTGGTPLSEQEVRNCLMLMVDPDFFDLINELKDYPNFKDCLNLKAEEYEKEVHMEYILRMFIGYHNSIVYAEHNAINKIIITDFLDKETVRLIKEADREKFKVDFKKTFDKLKNTLGSSAFKKFNIDEDKFKGGFNISAFEMLTVGLSSNIDTIEQLGKDALEERIKELYHDEKIQKVLGRGTRAIKRFQESTDIAREFFV
ncbi:DUF262 domain-containing protein [Vibrio cyclitrophicus]|uniref:DUF262 domain-containing protein n=1 Tax=Vibrio sp. 99K-1 TaxID=2607603 RepID=UPI001493BAE6|nr:DUF262 domain-containing protein [Vibrio sp. 99K-1]NOI88565.1 DUF262 domain-containing protein [Vibrio sp. 99K-1]